MKKIFIVILAVLLAIAFAGCETTVPPATGDGRPSHGTTDDGTGNGGENKDPDEDGGEYGPGADGGEENTGYVFTVTIANAPGELPEDLEAIWTKNRKGSTEVYSAKFVDGVATVEGLNGEYRITLSYVPKFDNKEYTYDSNGYYANNLSRDVAITLEKIIAVKQNDSGHNGADAYRGYEIRDYGTYRTTLNSEKDVVYYHFMIKKNGVYVFTSRVDTVANNINPIIEVWNGIRIGQLNHIQDISTGGTSGSFTKNFRFVANFATENLSSETAQVFGIKAKVNNIEFPITVDFTVERTGDYELEDFSGDPVYAKGPFLKTTEAGSWQYIYKDNSFVKDGKTYYVQDESKVVFNKTDRFYHVGTEDGPLLFAKLTRCSEMVCSNFKEHCYNLGFAWNPLNDGLIYPICPGPNGGYIDYSYMITSTKGHDGYDKYCNDAGEHPVNQQIKEFLQAYAIKERFFADGEGICEDAELNGAASMHTSGLYLQSDENSMWLYNCGYYKR